MLKISNVRVYDLRESITACRNSKRVNPPEYTEEEFQKGLARARKLVKATANSSNVKCHDNFLTGIRVSFDLRYPQYLTPQMQRYHWFDIVSSSSKMHKLLEMDFDKCCNEYVTPEVKRLMEKLVSQYNGIVQAESSYDSEEQFNSILNKQWMKVISNCPLGLELFMRVSTNYKQLQTMYHQRRIHRLEDWRLFCNWVETLPYSEDFITMKKDGKRNEEES